MPGRRSGARLSLIDVARRLGRPRVAVFSNRLTSVSTNTSLPDVRLADGSPRAPPLSHPRYATPSLLFRLGGRRVRDGGEVHEVLLKTRLILGALLKLAHVLVLQDGEDELLVLV